MEKWSDMLLWVQSQTPKLEARIVLPSTRPPMATYPATPRNLRLLGLCLREHVRLVKGATQWANTLDAAARKIERQQQEIAALKAALRCGAHVEWEDGRESTA